MPGPKLSDPLCPLPPTSPGFSACPCSPHSQRGQPAGMGEKSHLLSRGTSLRLHPPVERERAQSNPLQLLPGAQPRVCPDLLGECRGTRYGLADMQIKRTVACLPRSLPSVERSRFKVRDKTERGRKWAFESLEGSPNLLWKKLRKMPSTVTFTLTSRSLS